jgi:hypothetical protein
MALTISDAQASPGRAESPKIFRQNVRAARSFQNATGTSRRSIGCLSAVRKVTCLVQAIMSPESHTDDGGSLPRRKWIRHEYQSHA